VEPGTPVTYSLTLNVNTATSGIVITDTLPAQMTYLGEPSSSPASLPTPVFNASSNQLVWNLPALSAGTYRLSYMAQINNLVAAGTGLTNYAVLAFPGSNPVTASAQVVALGGYTVKIGVYNSAGELVDTILTEQNVQPILSFSLQGSPITSLTGAGSAVTVYFAGVPIAAWNGMTSQGTPATDGSYFINAESIDSSGNVTTVSQKAVVNRPYAQVTANVYNEAGEVVRHLYAEIASVPDSQLTAVQLSNAVIQPGLNPPGPLSSTQILIQTSGGAVTLAWDGTNDTGTVVTNGTYEIGVHWDNGNGEIQQLTRSIVVTGSRVSGLVFAEPNELNLSQGVSVTTFVASVPGGLSVNVSIYTLAGERVKTIDGVPGANQVSWNATGLASGIYIGMVEVLDSEGGILQRQAVKVQVIH
jgi:flagellar hook assembly protein FlgD